MNLTYIIGVIFSLIIAVGVAGWIGSWAGVTSFGAFGFVVWVCYLFDQDSPRFNR